MVGYYAKRRKSPTRRERKIVMMICKILCHVSVSVIFVSIHFAIFIVGKAMKTSITMEKTSVKIIFSIFIFHSIDEQNLVHL